MTSDTVATITIVAKGTSEDAQRVLSSNFTSSSISEKVASDLGVDQSTLTVSEPVAVFPPRPPPRPPPNPPSPPPAAPPPPPTMVINVLDTECGFPIIQVEGANNEADVRVTTFRRTAYFELSNLTSTAFDDQYAVVCAHSSTPPEIMNNNSLDIRLSSPDNILMVNGMVARQYILETSQTSFAGATSEWNVVSSLGLLSGNGCFSPPSTPPDPPPSQPPPSPPPSPPTPAHPPPPSTPPNSPPPTSPEDAVTKTVLFASGATLAAGGLVLASLAIYLGAQSGSAATAVATVVPTAASATAVTPLLSMKE